jgi:hypothetical protein
MTPTLYLPARGARAVGLGLAAAWVLLLGGCATMDATECQVTDWYQKGIEDGNRGYSEGRLDEHRTACAGVGVEPDAARYEEGRQFGLQAYCVPSRGLQAGMRGEIYRSVCPESTRSEFLAAYRHGEKMHETEDIIDENRREIQRIDGMLNDKNRSAGEKQQLYTRQQNLKRQNDQLRFEYDRLMQQADRYR